MKCDKYRIKKINNLHKCDSFCYTNKIKNYLCDDVPHGGLLLCHRGRCGWDSGSVSGGGGGRLSWDGLSDPSGGMVGR